MYTTTITRPYFPSSPSLSSSSTPTNGSIPPVVRTLCASLPSVPAYLLSKPIFHHPIPVPKQTQNETQIRNPVSDIAQRLPLPLPAPDISLEMKEKILSLELMGLDAGQALCKNPALREASLDSIQKIICFLQYKGIRYKDLGKMLGFCPQILTASIKHHLSPVFDFLSNDLQVPDKEMNKVVKRCPRILLSSVRDQLRPAVYYLQTLGLKDKNIIAIRHPVLLVLNVEKTMIPKVEYLASIYSSYSEAVTMVMRSPDLLTLSIENNLKPKYQYFTEQMKWDVEELREFPQYFAFSLDQRIKPRHRELVERGLKMPLSTMLKSVDFEFRKVIRDLEREAEMSKLKKID